MSDGLPEGVFRVLGQASVRAIDKMASEYLLVDGLVDAGRAYLSGDQAAQVEVLDALATEWLKLRSGGTGE